jgi:hypothetical protein
MSRAFSGQRVEVSCGFARSRPCPIVADPGRREAAQIGAMAQGFPAREPDWAQSG